MWALGWFMCSARPRKCRAQCDVLVIPQLVTILPRIFLSCFCVCCSFCSCFSSCSSCSCCSCCCSCCCCCSCSCSCCSCCCCCCCCCYRCGCGCCCCWCCCRYPCSFLLGLALAENHQIGRVFFFWNSRSKKHCKYRCLQIPMFFASGSKKTVFTVIFG